MSGMLGLVLVVALALPLPGHALKFQQVGQAVLSQETTLATLLRDQVTDCTRECASASLLLSPGEASLPSSLQNFFHRLPAAAASSGTNRPKLVN